MAHDEAHDSSAKDAGGKGTSTTDTNAAGSTGSLDDAGVAVDRTLRLTRARWQQIGIGVLVLAIFMVPMNTAASYPLQILNNAGILAIAGVSLNILTGYAGQISLGHAFFVGLGAFTAQFVGGDPEGGRGLVPGLGMPMVVWLPAAILVAGLAGAVIAPFALRLHGPYLAIVSLGLVFLGIYIARNLPSITGGNEGTAISADATLGPVDFEGLQFGPVGFGREQSLFVLIWGCLALVMLFVANVMRTRSGRAMQAVRDHNVAAEVLGVRMFRTQANAFILSTAVAGLCGGLLAINLQYIRPDVFNVNLSVQYLAIIVIGGMASAWGPILGALFVSLVPVLADRYLTGSGFVAGHLSSTDVQLIIYGSLIVIFLLLESKGLVALIGRASAALSRSKASG